MNLRLTLIISVFFILNQISAQDAKESNGYIGISVGASFWIKPSAHAKPGLNLALANFGYTFKKGFGIAARWTGAAHIYEYNTSVSGSQNSYHHKREFGYGSLMIGPMYSINLTESFIIDVKVVGGRFYEKFDGSGSWSDNGRSSEYTINNDHFSYCYSVGSSLRHNFSKRWSWSLQLDFNSGSNSIHFDSGSSSFSPGSNPLPYYKTSKFVSTISLGGGIQVRI